MTEKIRFHLDENVSNAVADRLGTRGIKLFGLISSKHLK